MDRFQGIAGLRICENAPLSEYTRFAIGGPALILADASTPEAFARALIVAGESGLAYTVIGGGSNLLVSDAGFPGVVLRFTGKEITFAGEEIVVEAGAELQSLVDASIEHGLRGLETMTGIPGWVGGAIYGNAGAYGHSIHERVNSVRIFDGKQMREIGNDECAFRYRESILKRRKDWIVVSAMLEMETGDPAKLARTAAEIRKVRDAKYPPTMHCAGSIFKNLLFDELPGTVRTQLPSGVVREGKVPSAYFLEKAGAKGMTDGAIRVAGYHANLIYNTGGGTAAQVRRLIGELKRRVNAQFSIALEEEVQYVP